MGQGQSHLCACRLAYPANLALVNGGENVRSHHGGGLWYSFLAGKPEESPETVSKYHGQRPNGG